MEYFLGVDIGGTDVKLGIVSSAGEVIASGVMPTMAGDGPVELASRVAGWFSSRKGAGETVVSAGLDCAGLVDSSEGMLHFSPNLPGWSDVPLASIFRDALGLEVTVENDVNAACWGEYRFGAGRETGCFVTLTLGTGVGGGIVLDGRLYRGAQGMAGEVGHQVIAADGPLCACGNRGCVEALVGAPAIIRRVREASARGEETVLSASSDLTVKEIAKAASEGDGVAVRALADAGRFLGIGLANIVHVLNPDLIAIGGGVAGAGDLIIAPARESMTRHLMSEVLASVRVVPAELGNEASFIGAASLAAERK